MSGTSIIAKISMALKGGSTGSSESTNVKNALLEISCHGSFDLVQDTVCEDFVSVQLVKNIHKECVTVLC